MVPKSDFFNSGELNPEWCSLGYTPKNKLSLTDRPGWLRLSPKDSTKANSLTKNDGEHSYSLITRMEFNAKSISDEAGLWIMRGDEKMFVKLVSSLSAEGKKVVSFSFENYKRLVENVKNKTVWLKLERINHKISGYYSRDGYDWKQIGEPVDISVIDSYSDFSSFTGTRQGLYVKGTSDAWFNFYIYRDAYSPILAECPANRFGTSLSTGKNGIGSLDEIHNNDWALYAGVEFGNTEYQMKPAYVRITASSGTVGGIVEAWLDSLDSKSKIAECKITNTGGWNKYKEFTIPLLNPVSGRHDVYLRFKGTGKEKLFSVQSFVFIDRNKKK